MIRALKLESFKAFRELSLPLGDLTVLSGVNSAGKSSVLQAIAMIRQSSTAEVGRESLVLNGDLVQLGTGRDVLFERSESETLAVGLSENGNEFSWWRAKVSLDADFLSLTSPHPEITPELRRVIEGTGFQYLKADRVSPEVVYPKSHERVVRQRSLGSRGEYTAHYLSAFRDEAVRSERLARGRRTSLLSVVEDWMGEVSPGVRIDVNDLKGTDFVQIRFGFGRSAGISGSQYYRPTHVGFGLMYGLPVVTASIGTEGGGLVTIENPEAHIHPKGQAAIGHLLSLAAATGLQVIVETHSDHILNGVRLAVKRKTIDADKVKVHFFARSDSGEPTVTSPEIGTDGHLSKWPSDFFDQWDRDLDALLE
jgi:predicted ATPase